MLVYVAVAVTLAILYVFLKVRPRVKGIPGPPAQNFLLGNLLQIQKEATCVPQMEWMRKYGPTVRYRFLWIERVMVTDPQDVKHILVGNAANYPKPKDGNRFLRRVTGNGSILVEEDVNVHHAYRKVIGQAFNPIALKKMTETFFAAHAQLLVQKWKETSAEELIDIQRDFDNTALGVICEAAFNFDVKQVADDLSPHYHANKLLGLTTLRWETVLGSRLPGFQKLPLKYNKAVDHHKEKIYQVVRDIVAQARETGASGRQTLLDNMVHGDPLNSDAEVNEQAIVSNAITFLLAGHETSSKAMTWTLYLLARHPHVQEKLAEEVRNVIGEEDIAKHEDLRNMPYLLNVVKESMRLNPPVPIVQRSSDKADTLPSGAKIPSNTSIVLVPFVTHRLPDVWGHDAEEFRPERWDQQSRGTTEWYPFMVGRRNCIGQNFAMLEIQMVVASLVQHFRFEWPEGQPTPKRKLNITMRPDPAVHLRVKVR
eukprot:TRINITY_DN67064_c1_g2_i1.p1 TRINITY_DN67064_c1_g2~~TRINITY_DN67064_c1_g2_i1.p1  ORF type:complete len:483 (-),score=42.48 TRINITY_DN67064_c1_g2_i1:196-1644(-)